MEQNPLKKNSKTIFLSNETKRFNCICCFTATKKNNFNKKIQQEIDFYNGMRIEANGFGLNAHDLLFGTEPKIFCIGCL